MDQSAVNVSVSEEVRVRELKHRQAPCSVRGPRGDACYCRYSTKFCRAEAGRRMFISYGHIQAHCMMLTAFL